MFEILTFLKTTKVSDYVKVVYLDMNFVSSKSYLQATYLLTQCRPEKKENPLQRDRESLRDKGWGKVR